jgi:hypothetical protein
MTSYAPVESGLLGGIPVAVGTNLQAYFDDAADEIDAAIGLVYETPVTVAADGGSLPRPVSLILKRINRYLASGRYIMAVASAGEDSGVHAYGMSLVREAQAALAQIAEGGNELDAKRHNNPDQARRAPGILNKDSRSNVDDFYDAYTSNQPNKGQMFDPFFPRTLVERETEYLRGW